jgi:hypothetical protein
MRRVCVGLMALMLCTVGLTFTGQPAEAGGLGNQCRSAWQIIFGGGREQDPCPFVDLGEEKAQEQTHASTCMVAVGGFWIYRYLGFDNMVGVGGNATASCTTPSSIDLGIAAVSDQGSTSDGGNYCLYCDSLSAQTDPPMPVVDDNSPICVTVAASARASGGAHQNSGTFCD